MNAIYAYGPVEVTLTGSEDNRVVLDVPHRGVIRTLRIKQISGTPGAGTFRFLTSEDAAKLDMGEIAASALVGGSYELYSVCGDLTLSGAGIYANFAADWFYRNRDGSLTSASRKLYWIINPAQSGDFAISMEIETPFA